MKKAFFILLFLLLPQFALAATQTIYITSGTSWSVPSDWNSSNNTIEVIGAGGGGVNYSSPWNPAPSGGGGGGGAYAEISNLSLTPGASIAVSVGSGGYWQYTSDTSGNNGGDTYFGGPSCSGAYVCGKGGLGGVIAGAFRGGGDIVSAGAGGPSAGSVGTVKYSGGAGDAGGGGAGGRFGAGNPGSGASGGSGDAGNGGAGGVQGVGSGGGGSGREFGSGTVVIGGHTYTISPGSGGGGSSQISSGADNNAGGGYGGGGGASYANNNGGGIGGAGIIAITYTPISAPTCTVSLSQNPLPYGSSDTLSWSSTNSDTSFYINTIGYVTPNQSNSTTVYPSANTSYSGTATGPGGTATCPATLTVTPPATPTTSITSSLGNTVLIGQSSTISASFAAGSGDTLTADNIDSPVGTGVGANTNPTSPKTYAFTPSTPGTYTFYSRAQTSYYSSWTTYNSVSVTVPTPPSATLTLSPTTIAQGQSSTLSWSSSGATSCTISGIGSVGVSGSTPVSPTQSTTYTGSCTGSGGTTSFNGGSGATLALSCTPITTYSCSGSTILQNATSSSCAFTQSSITSCTSPAFCSGNSSQCLYPSISFNQSGNNTGHLQIIPQILQAGDQATVYWNVGNASSCSVQGTNGDSWSGLTSGVSGETTAPIEQATIYTLSCTPLTGATSSAISETETVNITPVFNER